jgi:phosphate-selective porin OprO/OprP
MHRSRQISLAVLLLVAAASTARADDLPTDALMADSFGENLLLDVETRADTSSSSGRGAIAAAYYDAPEPLPKPAGAAADAHLLDRVNELEAKYADLQGAQDDFAHELDHYASVKSDDITLQINGRIHIDAWMFPDSSPGVNGFETGDNDLPPQDRVGFRRIRLSFSGDIYENMLYKIDFEFVNIDEVLFRDMYLGFDDLPLLQRLQIGKQKRPFGLDHWNSSNYNVFMERPFIIESFDADARRLGIESWSHSEDLAYNWQYGIFNQSDLEPNGFYTSDHWQAQGAGRFANTLWYDESSGGRGFAHMAIAAMYAHYDGNALTPNYADSGENQARLRTRPEARTFSNWLDTGLVAGAENMTELGLEHVLNLGPTQFAAEYQNSWMNREGDTQLHFHGAYAYLSYFLTGESMTWNRETGQLGPTTPFENFFLVDTCNDGVEAGWGAWQVAVRGSYGDLSDDDVQGGEGESITFGLNWYWNSNARMQFNYIYGNIYNNELNAVNGIDYGNYQIAGVRFMMYF